MSKYWFTNDHEWLRLEGSGEITVGITDFAQTSLGDVVFVQLPDLGNYAEGAEVAVLESVKAASNIAMPLTGEVVAVNHKLAEDPDLVNISAMDLGWFFRIRVANDDVLQDLMDQAAYDKYLAEQ
ncbi:glycine cleavage system protein GcvH [Pseudomonas moorei]|nr:glycine cleavage system protein GcvH [Pseudomonas moorei]